MANHGPIMRHVVGLWRCASARRGIATAQTFDRERRCRARAGSATMAKAASVRAQERGSRATCTVCAPVELWPRLARAPPPQILTGAHQTHQNRGGPTFLVKHQTSPPFQLLSTKLANIARVLTEQRTAITLFCPTERIPSE